MSDDIYSSATRPNFEVRSYSGCIVNRVYFHTVHRNGHWTTQNSGFFMLGESNSLYGVVNEVLDFQYA